VIARISQLGVPGFCAYLPPGQTGAFIDALVARGAKVVRPEAIDALRIEAGYPVFGRDMTGDTIPLEAGIESTAISFTKGCYVGQEIVIRVLHRGGGRVARKLVGLRIDGAAQPGSRILVGDRDVGFVTSVAESSTGVIGLGYVHRDFTSSGTRLAIASAGYPAVPATVTERPMSPAA